MKCFDDLRIDFAVDEINRFWLLRACSTDFITLKPAAEYHESPHKEKFIKIISEDQKMQAKLLNEDIKAQFSPEKGVITKRCGFC